MRDTLHTHAGTHAHNARTSPPWVRLAAHVGRGPRWLSMLTMAMLTKPHGYAHMPLLTRRAKLRKALEAKAEARAKAAAAMPDAAAAAGAKVAATAAAARSRAPGESVLRRLLSADSAQWVSAEQVRE